MALPPCLRCACSAPIIAAADPTGITTASVTVNPPAGATVTSYTVKLCLVSAPATCVPSVTYPTHIVPFEGLTPGAEYTGAHSRESGCGKHSM